MRRADVPQFFDVPLECIVVRCAVPYPTYVRYDVCLARLDALGRFLLFTEAWESLLGFRRADLDGRALLDLVCDRDALRRVLSPAEADPLLLEVRREDGGAQPMRWHRRFDPYDTTLFIVGEAAGLTWRQCRASVHQYPA